MSENKFNYFEVINTYIVKAKNKDEAEKVVLGRKGVKGQILSTQSDIERISAVEVREMLEV